MAVDAGRMLLLSGFIIAGFVVAGEPIDSIDHVHETSTEALNIDETTSAEALIPQHYLFGYDVRPREHTDSWHDAMYIMHPQSPLPHHGFVTSWRLYANHPANLTLLVLRHQPDDKVTRRFSVVGYNNISITSTKVVEYSVPRKERIHFNEGDLLGLYFRRGNPIPFSKSGIDGCLHGTMFVQEPHELSTGSHYVFRESLPGWNPCRTYSISAYILNTTTEAEKVDAITNTSPMHIPQKPRSHHTAFTDLEVRLIHGRNPYEGLVTVAPPGEAFGTVCDDGWDDVDADIVCRQLGYKGGFAQFSPFFGQANLSMTIYLSDVECNGDEASIAHCPSQEPYFNCVHRRDAGVQCIPNHADGKHILGYPAVPRSQVDRWPAGAYIANQRLPLLWSGGHINEWHFYIQTDTSVNLALQIWRPWGLNAYMLAGATQFTDLHTGVHGTVLNESDVIPFQAGDIIGFKFDNYNPLPYDLRERDCSSAEGVLYLDVSNMANSRLRTGSVYRFKEKPESWKACRMYSLSVSFTGEVSTNNHSFAVGDSQYHIVLDEELTQAEAEAACKQRFTSGASLARLTCREEMIGVFSSLNALGLGPNTNLWIGGSPYDRGLVTNWAHCQPELGRECIVLNKLYKGDIFSGDNYYMYTRICHERHHYICEIPEAEWLAENSLTSAASLEQSLPIVSYGDSVTTSYPHPRYISQTLSGGILAGLILLFLLMAASVIAFFLFMRRRTRHRRPTSSRAHESTVRFVSLNNKAPL